MVRRIGRLHVLTDEMLQDRFSHQELARLALAGGADTIQYREKRGSTREMIATASKLKEVCAAAKAPLIVNDRIDVALVARADGVHLGQDDFPLDQAREILGPGAIIGGSASNQEEVEACLRAQVDYIGLGPIFFTASKDAAGPASGLDFLGRIVDRSPVPIIAIGGIESHNAGAVMDRGAHGIAVISSVCCQEDPQAAAAALKISMG